MKSVQTVNEREERERLDIFVGSYAKADETGIHWLRMDKATGRLQRVAGVSGIANPSFLALSSSGDRLYAVSETDNGEVVSYAVDHEQMTLRELNRQSTKGSAPCHLSLDAEGRWLSVVNYGSGSVCTFGLEADGSLGAVVDWIQHEGRGVRADRQEAPHPHSIAADPFSAYHLVPDLGIDKVFVYRLEEGTGRLRQVSAATASAGAGPRHVAYHPQSSVVYVVCELDSTVVAYHFDRSGGRLTELTRVSLLPSGFHGANTAADVHVSPSGKYLYASNRGHDSIACFRIEGNGQLSALGHVATMGRTPRNFCITPSGRHLLVANQDSDSIVVMCLDEAGMPQPLGQATRVKRPVCLKPWVGAATPADQ
jgi:6-phosphogluconolactonase